MSSEEHWPADDGQFTPTMAYDLLASRRRRQLLYCLYMYATPMRLPDVAERLVEWDHDGSGAHLWDHDGSGTDLLDERLRIYNALYHSHVPKLADVDVVTYSQSEDMVDLGPNASHVRPYLEQVAREDLGDDEKLF